MAAQASPERAYQAYRREFPTRAEDYDSAAAYVAAVRAQAACPLARIRRVALTPTGRATVRPSADG